MTKVWK